ncbi:cupin domain-containing protein [Haloferax marisrubri]|uniref:Cupin domain-containing protein n=1 Tax=Haloferax marisrubri TaxID=1544719 RepID=A0A2P4NMX4_9EURY|nr:cupin domain-containing protein [Haloferax marisrubri]POG54484.1 cupin domain-containing protein [Haloferax marisrubri]
MEPVNLDESFASFDETWAPRIAAELNDYAVKVAKLDGEFVWHAHDETDELFLVRDGRLRIEFRDRDDAELGPGDLLVVPRGVEHRPVALEPTEVLLVEPAETLNTGDAEESDLTHGDPERLS